MLRKSLIVLVAAVGLTSCLKDPVESDITQFNREQEVIMQDYVDRNGLNATKQVLYSYLGDYFPIFTVVENAGDATKYTNNEAIWVAYTIRDMQNKVIETKTVADSVLIYEGGFSGKVIGLSWCSTNFLGKGGKGKFVIPASIGYGTKPPSGVETNAVLILDVEVIDRLTEAQQIEYFIKKNNIKGLETTASGLRYIKTHTTTDSLATGPSVTVKYTGKYANGNVFDSNQTATGATFALNGVIPGFSEAIKLMRKGEKVTAILPSKIAYGEGGNAQQNVPIYMPMIFEIELVKTN